MTSKCGAKRKEIDWHVLDGLLQYKASKTDCADILKVSEDTIERRLKEKGYTFTKYRLLKMSKSRVKLAQKQFEQAMAGNTAMLIWLGKNWLGQSDRHDVDQTSKIEINISAEEAEL